MEQHLCFDPNTWTYMPILNPRVGCAISIFTLSSLQEGMTIDPYEDVDDVSSVGSIDSCDFRLESGEILSLEEVIKEKKESKRKIKEWGESTCGLTGLLDTSGATVLEVNGRSLKLSYPRLYSGLTSLLWLCRRKIVLCYFTHPGGENFEGGMAAFENSPGLVSAEERRYSNQTRIAIDQYNENINNQESKLVFCYFIRAAFSFGFQLYITFTAWQNGELGTYQALLADDWCTGDVNLVLLRHLDADKIIAIMSLSGVEEEWEKLHGKNWKLFGSEAKMGEMLEA